MTNLRKSRVFDGPRNTKSSETDIFKMLKPAVSVPILKALPA